MSERREHKRRYNQKLEYIAKLDRWLELEPPLFPFFWRWMRWLNGRPKRTW